MTANEGRVFAHMVYFTLKEKTAELREKLLAGCQKYLTDHPGTIHLSIGARATDYQRPVNDQEFDVAVLAIFATEADHDRYQVSERHQQFLAEYNECWSAVRVFDAFA